MKRSLKIISLVVCLAILMAVPVNAQSNAESRGSMFFSSSRTYIYQTSPTSFQVWFDITANAAIMDEIGAEMIEVYRSFDGESWTLVKVYEPEDYPQMLDYNTGCHVGYVTYTNGAPGWYYCACVTYYAENSMGIGKCYEYTQIQYMYY